MTIKPLELIVFGDRAGS
uniref:Uncharacterized protein n=1 Tax=Rhizophora mucronata TaxID=61149 RepID=A0A2P2QBG7_RHIMU